jgi:hypothetical protein
MICFAQSFSFVSGALATVERDINDVKEAELKRCSQSSQSPHSAHVTHVSINDFVITKAAVVCRLHLSVEVYDSERCGCDSAVALPLHSSSYLQHRFIAWKNIADGEAREKKEKQRAQDEAEMLLVCSPAFFRVLVQHVASAESAARSSFAWALQTHFLIKQ